MRNDSTIRYSVVVPFFNEQENIPPLYMKITEVMDAIGEPYELVFVDDGSRDNTFKVLSDIYEHDHRVNIVRARRDHHFHGRRSSTRPGRDSPLSRENRRGIRPGQRLALRAARPLVDAAVSQSRGQLDDGQAVRHRSARFWN